MRIRQKVVRNENCRESVSVICGYFLMTGPGGRGAYGRTPGTAESAVADNKLKGDGA